MYKNYLLGLAGGFGDVYMSLIILEKFKIVRVWHGACNTSGQNCCYAQVVCGNGQIFINTSGGTCCESKNENET